MKIFSVTQMIAAEKAADAGGHSYAEMMEIAGKSVADAIRERLSVADARILVLVGPGNNGGDGLVAGRYLAEAGADVAFYLFKPRDPASDENFAKIQQMGLFVVEAGFDQRFRVLRTRLIITDILIDALLGTGVSRPIGGELAKLLKQIKAGLAESQEILRGQAQEKLVSIGQIDKVTGRQGDKVKPSHPLTPSPLHPLTVAVDCPSGLNCDTGEIDTLALPADLTVTFAGPKLGHFKFPGAAACGELVVADIGITPDLAAVAAVDVELMTARQAQTLLPDRPADGHKGTFGKVLIAAGCDRYRGAPLLAAKGAFRSGAGLVALAVPDVVRQTAVIALPEATYSPVADKKIMSAKSAEMLLADIKGHSALLVGPGLGEAADFMEALLSKGNRGAPPLPGMVVDADGLNLLAQMKDWPRRLPPNTILTPHPAEMARLMGISLAEMKRRDRLETAREQAQAWGHIVLLKGAYTVIAAPDGKVTVLPFANPVLAVGGSGDVLSGVIVALLGQGLEPFAAAKLGGYLHAATSTVAGSTSGLLAGEIADLIPQVVQRLRSSH